MDEREEYREQFETERDSFTHIGQNGKLLTAMRITVWYVLELSYYFLFHYYSKSKVNVNFHGI